VIASGSLAYANARVRARKSLLFDDRMLRQLRTTSQPSEIAGGEAPLPGERFRRLLDCYSCVIRTYPAGGPLFRSLVALHEVENLKLAWRARVRAHTVDGWIPLWRPLGALEIIRRDECRDSTSLPDLVYRLRFTPYGGMTNAVLRAHAADLVASELAFDRWAGASIASAAARLRRTEAAARDLALSVVRERDLSLLRRGVHAFGLSADAVLGSLVVLPRELPQGELARLATWSADRGPILSAWPKGWRAGPDLPADWDGLFLAVRSARRRACRRAFLASPYCLAPALALLLFHEEEVRGLQSLRESAGRSDDDAVLERVLAASAMKV
jgi:hypothetical protein